MIWHHVDLVSSHFHKRRVHVGLLAFVDALGFCSFLALLIVNGIIAGEGYGYWNDNGRVILMTYTSVPWMICW